MNDTQEQNEKRRARVRVHLVVGGAIGLIVGAGLGVVLGNDPSDAVLGAAMGVIFGTGAGLLVN